MSGLIDKIKDALHHDKRHDEPNGKPSSSNPISSQSFPFPPSPSIHFSQKKQKERRKPLIHNSLQTSADVPSVAHGSTVSPTNPGVLHSTKPGIHGVRDSSTATALPQEGGDGSRLSGTTWGAHPDKAAPDITGDAENNGGGGGQLDPAAGTATSAGPQYTGDNNAPDAGLVGSGLTGSSREQLKAAGEMEGTGLTGSSREQLKAAGEMEGTGYDGGDRSRGLTDMGAAGTGLDGSVIGSSSSSNARDMMENNNMTAGSGLTSNKRDEGLVGSGITSGTGLTSGNEWNADDDTIAGSGLSGAAIGADQSDRTTTSGTGTHSTDLATDNPSEHHHHHHHHHHHPGDGHPEDILHPGPHVTGTAKALDPHVE